MADGGGYAAQFQPAGPRNYMPFRVGRSPPRTNETPSPSRSPGPQSPNGNYGMFGGQGHQQHLLLNGGGGPSHQRYAMQMNLAQKYQQQQQQQQQQHLQQQNQQQQQQNQPSQPGQQGPQANQADLNRLQNSNAGAPGTAISHQHTYSGGAIGNSSYGPPSHLANGSPSSTTSTGITPHWAEQMQLYSQAKGANSPHFWAKQLAHQNKMIPPPAALSETKEGDQDEVRRPTKPVIKRDMDEPRQAFSALDFSGQGIRALSSVLFSYTFLDRLYINHNRLDVLPSAIGKLKMLTLLDVSNNNLQELPPELGMLTNLKTFLFFDNNVQQLPGELGTLYQLETLGVEGNPLQEAFKSRIMKEGTRSLIHYLRETCSITLPPVIRAWHTLDDAATKVDPEKEQPNKIAVVSYNVLCDRYAPQSTYGYTASWALNWDYRKDIIMQEILNHGGDIVCLQEVDGVNFEDFFSVQMAYQDYKGVFFPKTRVRNLGPTEQKTVDGCATFYKTTKFALLDKQMIDLSRSAINRADMKKTTDVFNRVMPRDNIVTVIFLEHKATGARILVANIHAFWDPYYEDVKLIQVAIMLDELAKMADRYAKDPPPSKLTPSEDGEEVTPIKYPSGSSIPLIICGDLNSTPQSDVYDLLSKGSVPPDAKDLDGRDYGNLSREGISHPFSLKSAYANIGELSFTNYTPDFQDVIDYIWYSTNTIQVATLLGEVDKQYLEKVAGFPNVHFPSDHLMLYSDFILKLPRKELTKPPPPDFGTSNNANSNSNSNGNGNNNNGSRK